MYRLEAVLESAITFFLKNYFTKLKTILFNLIFYFHNLRKRLLKFIKRKTPSKNYLGLKLLYVMQFSSRNLNSVLNLKLPYILYRPLLLLVYILYLVRLQRQKHLVNWFWLFFLSLLNNLFHPYLKIL